MNPYSAFLSTLGLFLTGSGTLLAQGQPAADSSGTSRRSSVVIRQSGQGNSATVIQSGNGVTRTIVSSSEGSNTTTVQHDGTSSVTIEQRGPAEPKRDGDKGKANSRKE
jgi:hypothetical protein